MKRLPVTLAVTLGMAGAVSASADAYPIGVNQAVQKAFNYAKAVCNNHGRCEQAAANQCERHNGGVSCRAHNFLRNLRGRKFECVRLVWYTAKGGIIQRQFLSKWRCYWGWSGFGSDRTTYARTGTR